MASRIRRLDPGLRLNDRVLVPVQRLARMTGVSPAEIIEALLEEIFEGDVPTSASPPPFRRCAPIIPITRSRGFKRAGTGIDLVALRRQAEDLRRRSQAARHRAAAAREAAGAARHRSGFGDGANPEVITPAQAERRR